MPPDLWKVVLSAFHLPLDHLFPTRSPSSLYKRHHSLPRRCSEPANHPSALLQGEASYLGHSLHHLQLLPTRLQHPLSLSDLPPPLRHLSLPIKLQDLIIDCPYCLSSLDRSSSRPPASLYFVHRQIPISQNSSWHAVQHKKQVEYFNAYICKYRKVLKSASFSLVDAGKQHSFKLCSLQLLSKLLSG